MIADKVERIFLNIARIPHSKEGFSRSCQQPIILTLGLRSYASVILHADNNKNPEVTLTIIILCLIGRY